MVSSFKELLKDGQKQSFQLVLGTKDKAESFFKKLNSNPPQPDHKIMLTNGKKAWVVITYEVATSWSSEVMRGT